ncbi:hypothetical protein [Streptomyces agglomeratus]|uniref:hypothetical protein n=1 Tax=Streptomyces agglomeratus TaxID=285458 RepID=UPI00114CB684|nr:hypothetical protein [Streptomyces agglomeratus]
MAKVGVSESKEMRAEDWPVPLLRNIYVLEGPADEQFSEARIALGTPLHLIFADEDDADD